MTSLLPSNVDAPIRALRHPNRPCARTVACQIGTSAAHLVRGDWLLPWSAGGYTGRLARPADLEVAVLTPESTVGVIRAGYAPDVHPSASEPAGPAR